MYRTRVIIQKILYYQAYYSATYQHEKNTLYSLSFYNSFVAIHSVFQQRNIVCKTHDKDVEQNNL